jgi:quercetin dioxygenase-like cupin family protein
MKLIELKDIPLEPVSHDPQILKQVMIDIGVVPRLTNFSRALIKAGQSVSPHKHDSAYEVLFLLTGKGQLIVDGDKIELSARQCLIVEPGELHSIPEVSEDIDMIYFGIEE